MRLKSALGQDVGVTAIATKLGELQHARYDHHFLYKHANAHLSSFTSATIISTSTLMTGSRPFGVNALLVGHDSFEEQSDGDVAWKGESRNRGSMPKIFCMRASGHIVECKATAIGEVFITFTTSYSTYIHMHPSLVTAQYS